MLFANVALSGALFGAGFAVMHYLGVRSTMVPTSIEWASLAPFALVAVSAGLSGLSIRDARDRMQAEADLYHLAHHDSLTGLANRGSFVARLDQELATASCVHNGKALAVLCLDLDRFKEVNDLLGHAAGDEHLQRVARAIQGVLWDGQMLARLGGDEFAVIAPDLPDPMAAGRIAEDILAALRAENASSPDKPPITTSIGIALFPTDGEDRETLLSHADIALYRGKAEGRDNYRFFEAAMGVEARERRLLERDLRQAITRGELRVEYQPQSRISSGEVVGFEALLRWEHAERGDIAPAVFIPIAEETSAILEIGNWVLLEACAEAVRWRNPLRIAVNVSAVQLHSVHFARTVHEVLLNTGLSPSRLELEVTETALIKDMNRALATLRQVKALGVRIAMDDFGVGFSSLSHLRSFPFDLIKIDGSFVRAVEQNEKSAAIIRAVLGLGRGLGLPVLAEGIETKDELLFLEAERCEVGQGYHLGAPAPAAAFSHLTLRDADDGIAVASEKPRWGSKATRPHRQALQSSTAGNR